MAAEFHEDAGAAGFAADTVSLSVERFEASTDGALVVNEFNHSSLSDVRDRASCFEPSSKINKRLRGEKPDQVAH